MDQMAVHCSPSPLPNGTHADPECTDEHLELGKHGRGSWALCRSNPVAVEPADHFHLTAISQLVRFTHTPQWLQLPKVCVKPPPSVEERFTILMQVTVLVELSFF